MSETIYDKANSIIELQSDDSLRKKVFARIQSLGEKVAASEKDDPFVKAYNDIVNEKKSSSDRFFLRKHVIEELHRLELSEYPRYLRYRYAYETNPTRHQVDKFPPVLQIEPTSICNYRCVFCYQTDERLTGKKNGHMGSMTIERFKYIIDQIEGHVEGVTLASRGEPSVNRDFGEMLKYMSGKFLAAKINTNASLLNEKLCHAILEADLQTIVFSADAAAEPLYSKLRVNGNLDKVLRNIERFHDIKERDYPKSKIITRVSGVKFTDNQNFDDMENFWSRFVDQVAFVDYNPWENVYDSDRKNISTPCSDLWRRMFIWWDGRVAPCDVDYLTTLSNETLVTSTISEIWNSDMYNNLREAHLSGARQSIEPCSRCVVT